MNYELFKSGFHLPAVINSSGGGIARLCLTLLLTLTASVASAQLAGSGTEQDPYIISSVDDWNYFTQNYEDGKYYALGSDVGTVNTSVGTDDKPFSGTFDGRGHTLTMLYNKWILDDFTAPFSYVSGATIKNLRTAGQVIGIHICHGGIVGQAKDKPSYFYDCQSSVTLQSEEIYSRIYFGGLIGYANAPVEINNCLFDGIIYSGDPDKSPDLRSYRIAGFVGITSHPVTIKNSLMAGKMTTSTYSRDDAASKNPTFCFVGDGGSLTVENSYWIPDSIERYEVIEQQGDSIRASDPRVQNGFLANALQGGQTDRTHWGQKITGENTDKFPLLTDETAKQVYKATFKAGMEDKGVSFANTGNVFVAPQGISGYEMLYDISQPATRDVIVALFQKGADGYYTITTKDDWDDFANYYKGTGDYRLAADIDGITTMACTNANPFKGKFDGAGHTLNVNYTSDEQFVGPFRFIDGATITNLCTTGSITGSRSSGCVGGLAGDAINHASTITNCESAVNLTYTGEGDATHAGFLGRATTPVTFNNCAFTGSITADSGYCVGGFVGWTNNNQRITINNCLVAADINVQFAKDRGDQGNAAFGRNWRYYTINNSYIVKFDNIYVNQGTYITDSLLRSGEMAWILQGSQDKQYWGQTLGTDGKPMLTTDNAKRVYKAAFNFEDDEVAAEYANAGNNFPTLTALKYESADPADYASQTANSDITVKLDIFKKDKDNFWLINNVEDWNAFTAVCSKGNFRLGADLDNVTTMAGTNEKPFTGTFDGDSHTLNVNYTFDGPFVAPFRYVKGATFRNLNVTGTEHMTGTDKNHCSGLLGSADGTTIERCTSSVALTFDKEGDAHSGGFVGHAQHSTVVIRDCAFTGSFTSPGGNPSVGGLIGWGENDCKANISDSYVDMKLNGIIGQNNLVRANRGWDANASRFHNCFYTMPDGVVNNYDPEPAELVTKEQMQDGYVAHELQRYTMTWGQTLTGEAVDAHPVLTSDTTKRVYEAMFCYGNKVIASTFTNTGKLFGKPAVTYKAAKPSDFDQHPAKEDIFVDLTLFNEDGDWTLIEDLNDWNNFTAYSFNAGNFRLTSDISDITTTVGTADDMFIGTFDGQGHTLTLNYAFSGKPDNVQAGAAPFRYVKGATIRNLHTAGIVTTSKSTSDASGLIGEAYGKVTVDNCESAAAITYDGNGDATNGGLIGRVNDGSSAALTNCAFTGSITSEKGNSFGGLIGWVNDKGDSATITNCLVAANINVQGSNNNTGNAPFARNAGKSIVTNSYYRDFANITEGYRKGEKVTDEQLASGEMAFKLQSSQDSLIWGQLVGTDLVPQLTADTDKRVLENAYDDNSKVYDNYVVVNEDKGNKANIQKYIGSNEKVKLVRTFAEGWNTLVVPFSLSTEDVKDAFGDEVQVAYFTNEANNTIELNTKEDTKAIEANVPVLVKLGNAQAKEFTFAGKAITNAEAKTIGTNDISFIGSYDALFIVPKDDYFINGTSLWKSEGNTTIKGTRAYFHAPMQSGDKLRLFIDGVEVDGSATGIEGVTSDKSSDRSYSSGVYTLSGQKIANNLDDARKLNVKQGVYIVNGKKIVIK